MRSLHGEKYMGEPDYWDQDTWELAFPYGIPVAISPEYSDKIKPSTDWDIYVDYIEKGGFPSVFHHVLEEWKSRNTDPKLTTTKHRRR
jgi:hypothetical protein